MYEREILPHVRAVVLERKTERQAFLCEISMKYEKNRMIVLVTTVSVSVCDIFGVCHPVRHPQGEVLVWIAEEQEGFTNFLRRSE